MPDDIMALSAEFAARMRELRVGPHDPRLAPLLSQMQALIRQQAAAAATAWPAHMPETDYAFDLPAELDTLLRAYLDTCPPQVFVQAPALSESDAGRRIGDLAPADKARMVVAAYKAFTTASSGGSKGGGLRRVVSDLLRAKLPLTCADAVALTQSAARDGFTYAGYSPNQAVLSALERHVAANGLAPELRRALANWLSVMTARGAEGNVQGRKLKSGVEALLARQESRQHEGAGNTVPLF